MTDENVGCLEKEALQRKARLQNLKKRKIETKENKDNAVALPTPKFRSYKPQDANLREKKTDHTIVTNLDERVQDQIQSAMTTTIDDFDINNLAPRKPDWDLKRDVNKKLEKLERRTQKAVAELIRERLKQEHNLATCVNIGATEGV